MLEGMQAEKMLKNLNIRAPIAIALGAIAGALSRYFIDQWLTQRFSIDFASTMIINLSGCWLMGVIVTLAGRKTFFSPDGWLLIATGFLGAYTTFSSYELDASGLIKSNMIEVGLKYWVGSPLLGFLVFSAGAAIGTIKPFKAKD